MGLSHLCEKAGPPPPSLEVAAHRFRTTDLEALWSVIRGMINRAWFWAQGQAKKALPHVICINIFGSVSPSPLNPILNQLLSLCGNSTIPFFLPSVLITLCLKLYNIFALRVFTCCFPMHPTHRCQTISPCCWDVSELLVVLTDPRSSSLSANSCASVA